MESEVILEFLEDAFPQQPLLPSDPLARSKVSLYPSFARMHIPSLSSILALGPLSSAC